MGITRVYYRERQRLTAADLRLEQAYRLGMGGRHHLAHHDWGVVRGLRVVSEHDGTFRLTPGVAIDGYGRALLVSEPLEFAVDGSGGNGCRHVLIHYCEDPEQVPPDKPCKDSPAPRIGQRIALWLSDESTPADQAIQLSEARVAGTRADLPPWPVLVARIGGGCSPSGVETGGLVDYSQTRYANHRAWSIHSPTARAQVQLGLRGRKDVYQFLISTRDPSATPSKRVAIDRDRIVHVWRPLVIAGTEAAGEVAFSRGVKLHVQTPLPAGLGRRIRVEGVFQRRLHQLLSASLVDLGGASAAPRTLLSNPVELQSTPLTLKFDDRRTASFKLEVGSRPRAAKTRRGARDERGISYSVMLAPTGGKLALRNGPPPSEASEISCADIDRTRGAPIESDTPVLQLRPAAEITAGASTREIHSVTTSTPLDMVPKTELRIVGGGADESDSSSRVSFGAQREGAYVSALQMDGGRRITIPSPTAAKHAPLFDVKGTTYLPPIGKDDPLLPDLITLAFVCGLRRVGSITTQARLALSTGSGATAASVQHAREFTYTLTITWPTSPFEVKRAMEVITGTEGARDLSFRALEEIAPDRTQFTVSIPHFAHRATTAGLQVLMLLQLNNRTQVAVSNVLRINVQN